MTTENKTKTKTILHNRLLEDNRHPRDEYINFDEPTHVYTIHIPDREENAQYSHLPYTSVTTWVHSNFPHFDADKVIKNMMKGKNWNEQNKYWGLTMEQIKEQWSQNGKNVSSLGTDMHYEIECFMNHPYLPKGYTHKELLENYLSKNGSKECEEECEEEEEEETIEWKYFLKYLEYTLDLKPYRTEWTVFHEDLHIAGSIDMIYENTDGTLSIYDWKRVKEIKRVNTFNKYALPYCISHMPDSNFWHYAMQLNTYKMILEDKYGKKNQDLIIVQIHPDNEDGSYEMIPLPDLSKEIRELFLERKEMLSKINI